MTWPAATRGLMAQSGQPHARLRRLVSAAFRPRQVERLRPRLRAYLTGLWPDIAPTGRCDVVTALARPLPSMAITELLGVPGDAALLARWSASLQAVFDMDVTAKRAEIEAANADVRDYVPDLVDRRHTGCGCSPIIPTSGIGSRTTRLLPTRRARRRCCASSRSCRSRPGWSGKSWNSAGSPPGGDSHLRLRGDR